MPLDSTSAFLEDGGYALSTLAPIVVIVSDPSRPGEMTPPQRSALAAADVVLLEEDVDPPPLNFVARGAFVEPVEANRSPMPARASGIARARKLASEGWRVVWLAAGNAERLAVDLADAGLVIEGRCAADAFAAAGRPPHLLATPLNGRAG